MPESESKESSSKRAITPHWDGEVYTRYISRNYDFLTGLTGWRSHIHHDALPGLPEGRLLDVGCGTGYLMNLAQDAGYEVYGVDYSEGMLEKARNNYSFAAERIVCASATELPFPDDFFDVVIACGSLVHVPDVRAVVVEMVRVLRVGGRIRIIDHAKPKRKGVMTYLAQLFGQLCGHYSHDYEHYFSNSCRLLAREDIGRAGYLQRFDFEKEERKKES